MAFLAALGAGGAAAGGAAAGGTAAAGAGAAAAGAGAGAAGAGLAGTAASSLAGGAGLGGLSGLTSTAAPALGGAAEALAGGGAISQLGGANLLNATGAVPGTSAQFAPAQATLGDKAAQLGNKAIDFAKSKISEPIDRITNNFEAVKSGQFDKIEFAERNNTLDSLIASAPGMPTPAQGQGSVAGAVGAPGASPLNRKFI